MCELGGAEDGKPRRDALLPSSFFSSGVLLDKPVNPSQFLFSYLYEGIMMPTSYRCHGIK